MTTGARPNSANRRRPWAAQTRALIWKEWRQQRWVALTLLALLAILIMAKVALLFHPVEYGLEVVTGLFVLLLGICPIVLGANAFCGETDDETTEFLRLLPARAAKLFWVKTAVVWCFCLVLLLAGGGALLLFAPGGMLVGLLDIVKDRKSLAGVRIEAGCALILGVLPALVSVWARRTLPCVIASIIALPGLAVGFFGAMWFLNKIGFLRGLEHAPFIIAVPFLIPVAFLAVSRWIWCWGWVERTTGARVRMAALLIALVALSLTILPAVSWGYYTFLAPPSAFGQHSWYWRSSPPPTGEFIALDCRWPGWGKVGGRAVLVDLRSNRAEWLTRIHGSYCAGMSVWSPSGNRLLLSVTDRWLWPLARDAGVWTHWVVDAKTGQQEALHSLCPEVPATFRSHSRIWTMGWSDEQTVAFGDRSNVGQFEIHFANIEKHALNVCRSSLDPTNLRFAAGSVFASSYEPRPPSQSGAGTLSLVRFAPDLTQAEVVSRTVAAKAADLSHVDDEGRRLIIVTQDSTPQNSYYLTVFQPEAPMELLASESEPQSALVPDATGVADFLPDTRRILLYGERDLILFDIEDHGVRRFPVAPSDLFVIESATLSPSGDRALVRVGPDRRRGVPGNLSQYYVVVDLATGVTWPIQQFSNFPFQWLGDDKLLVYGGRESLTMNYDGTDVRKLLEE